MSFLDTLFLNSYLNGLQKLIFYNHILKNYLQVLELDLKFVAIKKMKFKYLKAGEMFHNYLVFFSCTSILMS